MALVCNDHVKPTKLSTLSETTRLRLNERRVVKKRIAIVNFIAIAAALYLYDRHNRYCEPGIYSAFSFLEYIVIIANIVYHLQAYYDLEEYSFLVAKSAPVTTTSTTGSSSMTNYLQRLPNY